MNRSLFTLCLIFSLLGADAMAQDREYKAGMHHTFVRRDPAPAAPQQTSEQNTAQPETPQSTVWKKYKALARGENTDEETPDSKKDALPPAPTKPAAPIPPAAAPQAQEKPRPSGMAAIIEDYRKSKDQRRDMKSIRFKTPDVPKPEIAAPEVEKPETVEPSSN